MLTATTSSDDLSSDYAFEQFLATRSPIRVVREHFSKPSPDEIMLLRHAIERAGGTTAP